MLRLNDITASLSCGWLPVVVMMSSYEKASGLIAALLARVSNVELACLWQASICHNNQLIFSHGVVELYIKIYSLKSLF